jgi:hypothetical protein
MQEIIRFFIQSESFKSLLGIVLTAVLTYFFTRKSDNKKQDISIRKLQLEKIYLPLYLYLNDKRIEDINIRVLYENMLKKKRKYFLYLSNTYLFHLESIKKLNDNNSNKPSKTIIKCKLYINYEFTKLKRELGYPYKSDFKNSYFMFYLIKLIFSFLNMVLLIIFAYIFIFGGHLYDKYGNLANSLTYVIAVIALFDFIVGISYICYQILLYEFIRNR